MKLTAAVFVAAATLIATPNVSQAQAASFSTGLSTQTLSIGAEASVHDVKFKFHKKKFRKYKKHHGFRKHKSFGKHHKFKKFGYYNSGGFGHHGGFNSFGGHGRGGFGGFHH